MKNLVCFGFCVVLFLSACGKKTAADSMSVNNDSTNNVVKADTTASMQSVKGVINDNSSMNVITIITAQDDTMSFSKGDSVIESSGIIIGDTAVIFYVEETEVQGKATMPHAKKIIVTPAKKK